MVLIFDFLLLTFEFTLYLSPLKPAYPIFHD